MKDEGLLQDALEACEFVCRLWSQKHDPTPSDIKESYEACRQVMALPSPEPVG